MTDRLRGLDDEALGRAIASVARDVGWPPSPDLAARVTRTLRDREQHPSPARPRLALPRRRRKILLVVAGLLLLAVAAIGAKVVIEMGALTIDTIPGRPTSLPSAVASGPTVGHPATLADAEAEAGFPAQIPEALGSPDAVSVDRTSEGGRIVLAWAPSDALPAIDLLPWGAVLYEFHGQVEQASKGVFQDGNTFLDVEVGDATGFWITGPHELDLVTGDGTYARFLVTGNVLVWESDGIVMRLETSLGRADAIRIAESLSA